MPEVVNVRLEGELPEWATAKDVILEMLRRLSVKGGVGKIFEYTGPGVETLSAPERMTITNMGTELGATSSIFPTDERTEEYLERLGRPEDYAELRPDDDAEYHDEFTIDLSDLEPLIATPSMPDNVVPVREVAGEDVDQVIIGSCTNGGYEDVLPAAKMLEGRSIQRDTEMIVAPGSKKASEMLAREGWTAEMMAAARASRTTTSTSARPRSPPRQPSPARSSTRETSPTNSATSRTPGSSCPGSTRAPRTTSSRPRTRSTTTSSRGRTSVTSHSRTRSTRTSRGPPC
jgi:aconitase A